MRITNMTFFRTKNHAKKHPKEIILGVFLSLSNTVYIIFFLRTAKTAITALANNKLTV